MTSSIIFFDSDSGSFLEKSYFSSRHFSMSLLLLDDDSHSLHFSNIFPQIESKIIKNRTTTSRARQNWKKTALHLKIIIVVMAVLVEVIEAKKPSEAKKTEAANNNNDNDEENNHNPKDKKQKQEPRARQNWKKIFAVRKFISLAKIQSSAAPAELLIANRYVVGKKIANGAFGQLRLGKDTENSTQIAIKLEPVNAKIPMLFLEHRFYKVNY